MRLLLLMLLLCTSPSIAQNTPQRVRVGATFSVPMAYLSPEGEPVGFYVEVFREVARRENFQLQMVIARNSPEKTLESDAADIWAVAVPTPERRRRFYLTRPWWSLNHYLATLAATPIRSQRDLAGRTVLYTTAPPHTVPPDEFLPGAKLRIEHNLGARIEKLCAGQTDAILFYESTLYGLLGSAEFDDCRQRGIRVIPINRPVMELSIMSNNDNAQLAERIRTRIAEMQKEGLLEKLPSFRLTSNEQWKSELERERKENRDRILQLGLVFAVLLLAGSVYAYVRLRAAHRAVRVSLQVAHEANRVKSEFLATMSHEIRTPMTAALGYMEMLLSTGLRPEQEAFAREVTHATSSLLSMLTDVLDYSRSLSTNSSLSVQPFDPVTVIDDSISAVLLLAESKQLEFTCTIDPNVPAQLFGDANRLRHMILNLMANAVKFTSQGWVRVTAAYFPADTEGRLRITVSDSGIGIAPDKLELIFLPFCQVDSTHQRTYGGIGLGLAVVQNLCQQMGGSITVESTPGQGATFNLEVPLRPATPGKGWLDSYRSPAPAFAIAFWRDRPYTRILGEYLQAAGYSLKLADSSTVESLMHRDDSASSLFFIDNELCDEPLLVAIREAIRRKPNLQTRFVLLAGAPSPGRAALRFEHPFDTVLHLPVTGRALRQLLQPAPRSSLPAPLLQSLPVLVVDDNAVNRRLLSTLLSKLGCQVDVAAAGTEAIEKSSLRNYSLILMDCQMPVMNGFEATRQIRTNLGRAVTIIGVSAALESEVRQQCIDSGMDDYLSKPVSIDQLHAILKALHSAPVPE